ncbi:hypothetical protein EYR41_001430 [Orbilia oligospora]|uniref:Uncharacterized protein n=1 Tax=Orbilia oligospora TaxID=2813651 RepID=A0A8H2EBB2_ORBOL|nr:hypothetical protein EYR41_001430 [Orbilia oligospora]
MCAFLVENTAEQSRCTTITHAFFLAAVCKLPKTTSKSRGNTTLVESVLPPLLNSHLFSVRSKSKALMIRDMRAMPCGIAIPMEKP